MNIYSFETSSVLDTSVCTEANARYPYLRPLQKLALIVLGISFGPACGPASLLDHRRGSSLKTASMDEAAGIVPETAPTQSVLLSEFTIMDRVPGFPGTPEIAESVLKAGIDLVVIEDAEGAMHRGAPMRYTSLRTLEQKYGNKIQFFPAKMGYKKEWVRDYGPVTAKGSDGQPLIINFRYYTDYPFEDNFPLEFGKTRKIQVFDSPIKLEGGNFMVDEERTCVVSSKVKNENDTFDLSSTPYHCRQVIQLKPLPYEQTGHIDLFVKFLGQKMVLVGDYANDQSGRLDANMEFDAENFAKHLRSVQDNFRSLGYQVITVPMPVPSLVRYNVNDRLEDWQLKEIMIRSYVNSLLLNRDGRRIALVPRFEKQKIRANHAVKRNSGDKDELPQDLGVIDYPDQDLISGYETSVQEAYKKAGYEVEFIPSDHLLASSGAVHCLTMQIPSF